MNAQQKSEKLEDICLLDFSDMAGLGAPERVDRLKSAFQPTPEEKIEQLSRDYQKILFTAGQLQEERNELLEENIQLGEALEKAHEMLMQEKSKTKDLSQKIKALLEIQDKGKLRLHARILQMNMAHKEQQEEIKCLREKVQHIGRMPLREDVVQNILRLRHAGYSYSQIAQSLGISRGSVSKYLNKAENRKKSEGDKHQKPGWTATLH